MVTSLEITGPVPIADVTTSLARVVTVPPPAHWYSIGRPLLIAIPVTAAIAVIPLIWLFQNQSDIAGLVIPLIEFGCAAIALTLFSIERAYRRVEFEVTPLALAIVNRGPFGSGRRVWPRAILLEIHLNRFNGRMVVRRLHRDATEIYLGPDRALNARVVDELDSALREIPPAAGHHQTSVADPDAGISSTTGRKFLIGLSIAMAMLAMAGLMVPRYGTAICLYGMIPAAIPVGIAMGTQRKYWM